MFRVPSLEERSDRSDLPVMVKVLCALIVAALSTGLIYVLYVTEPTAAGLTQTVSLNIEKAGVSNPVTAVLLNFRSYDTLLEVAVLLIVAVAMLPMDSQKPSASIPLNKAHPKALIVSLSAVTRKPLLEALLRWLIPTLVVMAGYILWTGSSLPGGAFQAGALLAGSGVLLLLAEQHRFEFESKLGLMLITGGLLVFALVGGLVFVVTGTVLAYPPQWAGALIMLIELAATLSIAAILVLLYQSLAMTGVVRDADEKEKSS